MASYIIIAPHADDELIGCYELLVHKKGLIKTVLFPDEKTLREATLSAQRLQFDRGLAEYLPTILGGEDILVAPDPYFELHPEHRYWGMFAEWHARKGTCKGVIFYSTNMNAPYIRECKDAKAKHDAMDLCYPTKMTLWYTDHKYFLFEGHTEWIFKWQD